MNEIFKIEDKGKISCCKFSPDGEYFVIGTKTKKLSFFNLRTILEKKSGSYKFSKICKKDFFDYHKGAIYEIDWSGSGELLATCSIDKSIKISNFKEKGNLKIPDNSILLKNHKSLVRSVCFSSCEKFLFSGGGDGKVKIWDIKKNKNFSEIQGDIKQIQKIKICENENLISFIGDSKFQIWDFRQKKKKNLEFSQKNNKFNSLIFSHNPKIKNYNNLLNFSLNKKKKKTQQKKTKYSSALKTVQYSNSIFEK